jgi:HK97 family phage portal protein
MRVPTSMIRSVYASIRSRIPLGRRASVAWSMPVLSGVRVTPETALSFTAVYAAINRISTDLAALSLQLYERLDSGGREPAPLHRVYDLVHLAPNEETSSFNLRRALWAHALGWGNGYAEIVRDTWDGSPREVHLMDPSKVNPDRSRPTKTQAGGRLVYVEDGNPRAYPSSDIIHLAPLGFDGLRGYSPIALAKQAIGLGIAAEAFGASLFGNGAAPGGVLKTPKTLDDNARHNLRESWRAIHSGDGAHTVALLEEGMEWQSTTIPPEHAQFLQTRQFQVVEIARLYQLPPHKIGDYSQSHLANVEEANLDYLSTTIMPWCVHAEQELNRKLLFRDERSRFYVEHALTSFLRGNMAARAQFYQAMSALGVMSPNAIARAENLNPIGPAGDLHLVPLNMAPIEEYLKPAPPPIKADTTNDLLPGFPAATATPAPAEATTS